jgi:predicted dehydrogenase
VSNKESRARRGQSPLARKCCKLADFREVCRASDIDAVSIVVPDHWHALVRCGHAGGQDCEKAAADDLRGREMVKPCRWAARPAQFALPGVRRARAVLSRRIGEVRRAHHHRTQQFSQPGAGPAAARTGRFDYDFWLGPAPEAPYHIERCFHRWRYILDYSNGQTANFGAHTNDMAQWALGMDGTTPVEFEDNGSEFLPKGACSTRR